jgi:hypothetical protein
VREILDIVSRNSHNSLSPNGTVNRSPVTVAEFLKRRRVRMCFFRSGPLGSGRNQIFRLRENHNRRSPENYSLQIQFRGEAEIRYC